jgi:hypothetical protein
MKNTENIFEIITNSSFAHYMTIKEWRLFIHNYELAPVLPYKMNLSSYFDMNKNESFYDFMRYAFFFAPTPEGLEYWFIIAKRDLMPYKVTIGSQVSI